MRIETGCGQIGERVRTFVRLLPVLTEARTSPSVRTSPQMLTADAKGERPAGYSCCASSPAVSFWR